MRTSAAVALSLPAEPPSFDASLLAVGAGVLRRGRVTTLQVNVGKLCNMACHHCHVEAGPQRTELMSQEVAARVVEVVADNPGIELVDLTGGAPELNPSFRWLVSEVRRLGRRVIDRCNLTVLFEPGLEDLPRFLAEQGVEVVASLPCYQRANVEKQRGKGAFGKSVDGLRLLNGLGYGRAGSGLVLDLAYNPVGPSLPPPQASLETTYRRELGELFGIEFSRLLTLANMPIKRFAHLLERTGQHGAYMSLLVNHFNAATVPGLMCRSLLSVGWDGRLYDCDFNQMLELPLGADTGRPRRTLFDIDSLDSLDDAPITTGDHCYGCTAGAGSSCGGALR